jgi:2-polyprenyl-3-methyl-5-hydroxy-6-metoxy-1,4-benzoquinol methylase
MFPDRDVSQCPVCGHAQFVELYSPTFAGTSKQAVGYFLTDRQKAVRGRIVRCANCSFVLTSPQFEPEEYAEIYRTVAAIEKPAGRTRATAARYRNLADLTRGFVRAGRFLDFGCGDGQFLEHMLGFQGIGLELRSSEEKVHSSADGRIVVGELQSATDAGLLPKASFEFITAWDVIEHLPRLQEDVATLRSLLKPDGFLFCTVPNVASLAARLSGARWNCYLLEHLWYFSPATLTAFFEREGFIRRAVQAVPFPADMLTLAARIRQTYGVALPVPRAIEGWTVPLPAGVMFGAFQLRS